MLFAFENTPHIRFYREGSIGRLPERTLVQVPAPTMVTVILTSLTGNSH